MRHPCGYMPHDFPGNTWPFDCHVRWPGHGEWYSNHWSDWSPKLKNKDVNALSTMHDKKLNLVMLWRTMWPWDSLWRILMLWLGCMRLLLLVYCRFFWTLGAATEKPEDTLDEFNQHAQVARRSYRNYIIDIYYLLRSPSGILPMRSLFLTLLFIISPAVNAGNSTKGQPCNVGNSRLQIGTYQFWDECNVLTFCSEKGVCEPKRCRKDEYPFGYAVNSEFPPKCPRGLFCPDEGSDCQPRLPVGSPCQLNRDGAHIRFLTTSLLYIYHFF
jgi:hypothetical protein